MDFLISLCDGFKNVQVSKWSQTFGGHLKRQASNAATPILTLGKLIKQTCLASQFGNFANHNLKNKINH